MAAELWLAISLVMILVPLLAPFSTILLLWHHLVC